MDGNLLLCYRLKKGRTRTISRMDVSPTRKVKITDSVRNWLIRNRLDAPATFLTPTSLARLAERAVIRFMKLIQAINRMIIPTKEKI